VDDESSMDLFTYWGPDFTYSVSQRGPASNYPKDDKDHYSAVEWHDSGEFGPEIAKSWLERVHDSSSRYVLVAVPNHWSPEVEDVIGWIDAFGFGQRIYVAMGKLRR
jgi:hypothetical protein